MRGLSPTLITDELELNLYEAMKYDQVHSNGQIRAYLPPPRYGFVYVPITATRQRYGWRIWFLCPRCKRRTSKLYYLGTAPNYAACRLCRGLKYPSQYKKDAFSKSMMNHRKLERLEKQQRRLWYGDYPTQFGIRYQKLQAEHAVLHNAFMSDIASQTMRVRMELAVAKASQEQ